MSAVVSTHLAGFSISRTGRGKTFVVDHEQYGAVGYYSTEEQARKHIASCLRARRRIQRERKGWSR